MTVINYAKYIDHTLLKPEATQEQIAHLCTEAKRYQFASVCVNSTWVKIATNALKGTNVKVCTVIGFPLGATTTAVKAFEAEDAIKNGAQEIDMVINIGALKSKNDTDVLSDIEAVVNTAKGHALVKVIIETCLLTDEEKRRATELSVKAGANYVKTSTGFSTSGATSEDVRLMRKIVGNSIGVKASGGVRSLKDVQAMIAAGASRIGTSSGVKIIQGLVPESDH